MVAVVRAYVCSAFVCKLWKKAKLQNQYCAHLSPSMFTMPFVHGLTKYAYNTKCNGSTCDNIK